MDLARGKSERGIGLGSGPPRHDVASDDWGGQQELPVGEHDDIDPALSAGQQSDPSCVETQVLFDKSEKVFNGLITNDKFCITREVRLKLSWWRRALKQRDESKSPVVKGNGQGDSDETRVEETSGAQGASRRTASLGSGFGGKASSLYHLVHRTSSEMRAEFGPHDERK